MTVARGTTDVSSRMHKNNKCMTECHYGWVVVLAAAIIRILVYGVTHTSGMVYVVVLEVFKSGEAVWITSLLSSVVFFVTPFAGILINRFGMRVTSVLGGVVCCFGLVLSLFATSTVFLIFTYGLITGLGCGLAYMPCSIAVSKHFKQRLNLALGIASAGGGVGSFIFPPVVEALYENFGWRGMFLILGGISLNICVFGLLFRHVSSEKEENAPSFQKLNSNFLSNDWSFLRIGQFHVLQINGFLFGFGSSIVYGHLGAYLYNHLGYSKSVSAYLYSVFGISVTLCKILQGFTADCHRKLFIFRPIDQLILYYLFGGLATVILPFFFPLPYLIVFSIIFGSSYAAAGGSLIPSILILLKGKDQLSLTYSVTLAVHAIGFLLGAPSAGWIHDHFHSYTIPFLLAGAAMIASALIMIFPQRSTTFTYADYEITVDGSKTDTP